MRGRHSRTCSVVCSSVVVVAVGVRCGGASRRGVVAAVRATCGRSRLIFVGVVGGVIANSSAGIARLVADTIVVWAGVCAGFSGLGRVALLATEHAKALLAIAARVVVIRGGPEALLLLVMAHERDLHTGGAKEEDSCDDGDGESGGVEVTSMAEGKGVNDIAVITGAKSLRAEATVGVGWASAEGGIDVALAGRGAVAGQDEDGNHASAEAKVKDDGENGQAGNAAEAACQDCREDEVDAGGTGDAFDCLLPCGYLNILAIGEDGEEL